MRRTKSTLKDRETSRSRRLAENRSSLERSIQEAKARELKKKRIKLAIEAFRMGAATRAQAKLASSRVLLMEIREQTKAASAKLWAIKFNKPRA